MLKRRFIYSIEGLRPFTDERTGFVRMGGFGFAVYLDTEFAKLAHQKELPEGHHLNEIAESILVDCKLIKKKEGPLHHPYTFAENQEGTLTSLLRYIQVPGNACDLGLDGSEYGNIINRRWEWVDNSGAIMYNPHNVDNHYQAYALLSLFTTWADIMKSVLEQDFIEDLRLDQEQSIPGQLSLF